MNTLPNVRKDAHFRLFESQTTFTDCFSQLHQSKIYEIKKSISLMGRLIFMGLEVFFNFKNL